MTKQGDRNGYQSAEHKIRLFMFNSEEELRAALPQCEASNSFCAAYDETKWGYYYGFNLLFESTKVYDAFSYCTVLKKESTKEDKPYKLRSIIEFNSLICALSTFSYLESLQSDPKPIPPDPILNVNKLTEEQCVDYIRKQKTAVYVKWCLSKLLAPKLYLSYKSVIPTVEMLIHDVATEQEMIETLPRIHDIGWTLQSIRKRVNALIANDLKPDYKQKKNNIAQRSRDANQSYLDLFSRIVRAVKYKLEDRKISSLDFLISEFVTETVLHVHALACCEKEIKKVYDSFERDSGPFLFKLILRGTVPLVFGMNDISFSHYLKIEEFDFSNYIDYLKQTIILAYKVASIRTESNDFAQICIEACKMLRHCISNHYDTIIESAKEELIEDLEITPIAQKGELVARTIAACKCFEYCGFGCYYQYSDLHLVESTRDQVFNEWIAGILNYKHIANPDPLFGIVPASSKSSTYDKYQSERVTSLFEPPLSWGVINEREIESLKTNTRLVRKALNSEYLLYGIYSFILYTAKDDQNESEVEFKKLLVYVDCKNAKTRLRVSKEPAIAALVMEKTLQAFYDKTKYPNIPYEFYRCRFEPFLSEEGFNLYLSTMEIQ